MNARSEARMIIDYAKKFCTRCVPSDMDVVFTNALRVGLGSSCFDPGHESLTVGTGTNWRFFGFSLMDAVATCVAAGHELRHLEQSGLIKIYNADVPRDVCISHLACRYRRRSCFMVSTKPDTNKRLAAIFGDRK